MLTETSPTAATPAPFNSSPRQARLEQQLTQVIAAGAPRSAIRQAVDHLVLHLRARQVPAARGLVIVMDVASRAVSMSSAEARSLDMPVDRLTLVARWASQRYPRAD